MILKPVYNLKTTDIDLCEGLCHFIQHFSCIFSYKTTAIKDQTQVSKLYSCLFSFPMMSLKHVEDIVDTSHRDDFRFGRNNDQK